MTKIITTILVALFAVACAGEPFTGDAFSEIQADAGEAGEAGATDVAGSSSAGSAGASRGGSPSVGGSSVDAAGMPAGGTMAGGTSAGGSGGAPVNACEFDASKLSAALPKAFAWKDFSMAEGNVCASCTYEPCAQLAVAWGKPEVHGDVAKYSPTYTSTASVPLLVHVTKNDGQCAGGVQCEVAPTVAVSFTVARKDNGWQISTAAVTVSFADDDCTRGVGDPGELTSALALDLQQEIQASLTGLKLPCN